MQSLPVVALFLFATIVLWGAGSIAGANRRGLPARWSDKPNVDNSNEGLCKYANCRCRLRNGVPECIRPNKWEYCRMPFPKIDAVKQKTFCASDGRTYYDMHALAIASCEQNRALKVKHEGKCHDPDDSDESSSREGLCVYAGCRCRLRYGVPKCLDNVGKENCQMIGNSKIDWVCGSDERSYPFPIWLAAYSCEKDLPLTLVHMGNCRDPNDPSNEGLCKHAGCIAKCRLRNGVPKCIDKKGKEYCLMRMTRIHAPVCASDGRTYGNLGWVAQASCDMDAPLTVVRKGECDEGENNPPVRPRASRY